MADFIQNPGVRDLMRLVANDAADPHKAIEKTFEWKHSRALEVGKWSLAGCTALLAAVAAGLLKEPSSTGATASKAIATATEGFWVAAALGVAGVLFALGVSSLLLAGRLERKYYLTLALVAKLVEIRPFLKRAQADAETRR